MLLKQAAFWHKKSCRPTTAFSVATEVGIQKLKVGSRKSEVRSSKTLLGFRIICIGTRLTQRKILPSSRHALLSNLLSTAESQCRCGGNTRAQKIIAIRIVG